MPDHLSTARGAEHTAARWTIGLLCACLALEVGTIASGLSQRALVARAVEGGQLPTAAHDVRAITKLKLATLTGTGIIWLVWLRRAYRNLGLVGSKRSRFTTGQAIGYWFIPFVNVVRAYQVMRDLWLRSESMNDRDGYDDLPAPALLSGWWGMCLTWGVVGPVVASTARDVRTAVELANITDVRLIGSAVGIVAAVLAIRIVWAIDVRQQCFSSDPPDLPASAPPPRHRVQRL